MEVSARTAIALLLALAVASGCLCGGAQGRRHRHTKHTRHNSAHARAPAQAPGPASSRRHAPPHARPVSPPAPPPSSSSGSGGAYPTPGAATEPAAGGAAAVYDVVKDFGAVGDGVADDTDAIKTAWDTACADDGDGVVLAAAGYSFLVHATVFTGPCQGSVTIQVRARPPAGRRAWGEMQACVRDDLDDPNNNGVRARSSTGRSWRRATPTSGRPTASATGSCSTTPTARRCAAPGSSTARARSGGSSPARLTR